MSQKLLLTLVCTLLSLSGCNLIYKQNVQQGNAIEQEKLDQLKIGMTMNQVAFLLGTPAVRDPFHQQRWDYYYSLALRGREPAVRLVTLRFKNSILDEVVGADFDDQKAVMNSENSAPAGSSVPAPAAVLVDPDNTENVATTVEPRINAVNTPDATTEPVTENSETPSTVTPVVENESTPETPTATEPTATAGDTSSMWIIQLGAFDSRINADNLLARMNQSGYQGEVLLQKTAHLDDRFLVRTRQGFNTRTEAQEQLESINSTLELDAFLIPPTN